MAKSKSTVTVGERFVAEIKKRYATIDKTVIDTSPDHMRELRAQVWRKYLKLPKSVQVECTNSEDSDVSINGVLLEPDYYNNPTWKKFLKADRKYAAAVAKLDKAEDMKNERCKKLALLNQQLGSPEINKFKAYVRAKYDKLENAGTDAMNAADFKALVSEFLHTLKTFSCPL